MQIQRPIIYSSLKDIFDTSNVYEGLLLSGNDFLVKSVLSNQYFHRYHLHESGYVLNVNNTLGVGEYINWLLNHINLEARCDECGGLPYEIDFNHKGRIYRFSLSRVESSGGEILAETGKHHEYVSADEVLTRINDEKWVFNNVDGLWFLEETDEVTLNNNN